MTRFGKHIIIGAVLVIALVAAEYFMLMSDDPHIGVPVAAVYCITIVAMIINFRMLLKLYNEKGQQDAKHQEH